MQIAWSVIIVSPIIIEVSIFLIFYFMIGIGGTNRETLENNGLVEKIEEPVVEETVVWEVTDELEEEALDESEAEETVEETATEAKITFISNRAGNDEIYIMNVDGSNPTRLTNDDEDDVEPCFSPDGSKIAFQTVRYGDWEIYVMNVDGSGQVNLTNAYGFEGHPCFSH